MDKLIKGSWAVAVLVGFVGACAQDSDPDDIEVQTREIDDAELAELLSNANEVVPVTDYEVATFRSAASSCGVTVTQQSYGVDSDEGDVTISVSCTHAGCAGGTCSAAGCQPDWDKNIGNFCTPPTCIGTGCAPLGCSMKTTVTEPATL